MPFYLDDVDIPSHVEGSGPALIVSCYMCPAVTVAAREGRPLLRLLHPLAKSEPFERFMSQIRASLARQGVASDLYRSLFLCMWPTGRREKLARKAEHYGSVIVLGCDSAVETVRDTVEASGCKVIPGMKVAGITNLKMAFTLRGGLTFREARMVPIAGATDSPSHQASFPGIADGTETTLGGPPG